MSRDPLKAGSAIQPVAPRAVQTNNSVDAGKAENLLARAAALIEAPAKTARASAPSLPVARVEFVRVPMVCAATGRSWIEIGERRGHALVLQRHDLSSGGAGSGQPPALLSDEYVIETAAGWTCPFCRSARSADIWVCNCELAGALHCSGSVGRARYCACGRFEERHFVETPTLPVRGTSAAATPGRAQSGAQRQSQTKQVTHARSR